MTISNLIERGNPEDMDQDMPVEIQGGNQMGSRRGGQGTSGERLLSRNVVVICILVLTSSASFGLGMLAGQQGSAGAVSIGTTAIPAGGEVVASHATHAYYLPWCSQAMAIKNEDKVWFTDEQMAKSAGYTAGKGCAGI